MEENTEHLWKAKVSYDIYYILTAAECSVDGVLATLLIIMTKKLKETTPGNKGLLWLTVSEDTVQSQKDLVIKVTKYFVVGA